MAIIIYFFLLTCYAGYFFEQGHSAKNFVKPQYFDKTCPDKPCLTFDDYLQEEDKYFRSNSTFIFLPGIHQMEFSLKLKKLRNMMFIGDLNRSTSYNTSQLIFGPSVNITWTLSYNITITNLMFHLSGTRDSKHFHTALYFVGSLGVKLSIVTFVGDDNFYSAAVSCRYSEMTILQGQFFSCSNKKSPGVTAVNCTILAHNNTFVNNTATTEGGAVSFVRSTVKLAGMNTFHNNVAGTGGGAIYCGQSTLMIEGSNYFSYNLVTHNTLSLIHI